MYRKELSRELKSLVASLDTSSEFKKRGREATSHISAALQRNPKLSVDRVIVAGSVGKGTAINDGSDLDIVVFLNEEEPPFEKEILEAMESSMRGLSGYIFEKYTRFSVQFSLKFNGVRYDFDLLPAANMLSQRTLGKITSGEQCSKVRRRLKKYEEYFEANKGYAYNTSLSEQTVLFLKKRPKEIVDVIKLAKYWNSKIEIPGRVSGRNYMVELVAVRAQHRRNPGCGLLQKFLRFLNMMKNFGNLEIVFGFHYQRTSVPENILKERPLIMDPVNFYNNIASGINPYAIKRFEEAAKFTLSLIEEQMVESIEELFPMLEETFGHCEE